jgi:hypothetical protein
MSSIISLEKLFKKCLDAPYLQVENDGSYYLENQGNTLYIFLECSNGATDWKNNFDFWPIARAGGQMCFSDRVICCARSCDLPKRPYKTETCRWYAHRGFLRVWRSVEGHIAKELLDPRYQRMVVVGYSHGAALAVLCHEFIWYHRPDLRDSLVGYGFGCPRVLWGIQSKEMKKRWERFTVIRNIDDIVTHLPPAWLGFSHVGEMLAIGEKGKYTDVDAHRPENISAELRSYIEMNFSGDE